MFYIHGFILHFTLTATFYILYTLFFVLGNSDGTGGVGILLAVDLEERLRLIKHVVGQHVISVVSYVASKTR